MPGKAIKKSPISFLENTPHFRHLSNVFNSYNIEDEFFHMFLTFFDDNRLILWISPGNPDFDYRSLVKTYSIYYYFYGSFFFGKTPY